MPMALQTSEETNQGLPSILTARMLLCDSNEKLMVGVHSESPVTRTITTATPITGGELNGVGVPASQGTGVLSDPRPAHH